MNKESYIPCPFCGTKPQRNEEVSPAGFIGVTDEEKLIYIVSCATSGCIASGVSTTDVRWNQSAVSQESLREEILKTLMAEDSDRYEAKRHEFGIDDLNKASQKQ
nr:hypothetical protein [uncultured Enterobacter sp.]DAI87017.1 MAG TPA: restriction alleviation protein [Caudoviricetes sp.]